MEKNAPYVSRLAGLKRIKSLMGGDYVHRKHSEAEGHRGHNNSSGSQHKESGGLAPCKEYWHSRGDERERRSWSHFRTRNRSCIFSLWRAVSPDESVSRAMNLMTHHRVRHILVLSSGELAGIVSIGDVVRHRLEDLELETNVLRDVYNAAR